MTSLRKQQRGSSKPKTDIVPLPKGTQVPNHIAMILDGNRRCARARGLEPWEGHKAGYEAVKKLPKLRVTTEFILLPSGLFQPKIGLVPRRR